MNKLSTRIFFFLFFCVSASLVAADTDYSTALHHQYQKTCNETSDIFEHVPVLRHLAMQCSSVVEIGLRTMNSSWGILKGLSENGSSVRSYVGIDLNYPPESILSHACMLATANDIDFRFIKGNDMQLDIEPCEMLFIDSLHTYCHLTYELEKFSPIVSKYIVMHDTSEPWGEQDEDCYHGDYSEYPAEIDRAKRGLWAAVEDFLTRHPEWLLQERRLNNHGLTTLRRF